MNDAAWTAARCACRHLRRRPSLRFVITSTCAARVGVAFCPTQQEHVVACRPLSSSLSSEAGRSSSSSTREPPAWLTDVIRDKIESGDLVADPAQQRAAGRLARLQGALQSYDNKEAFHAFDAAKAKQHADGDDDSKGAEESESERSKEVSAPEETRKPIAVPRGMFLHGSVGTGKSMLMDTFYEHAPVRRKRRVHFHSFMADVHSRIHRMKQRDLADHGRSFKIDTSEERNPIYRLATELAGEVSLLCFDEFQVTDVADALILSQLFGTLWARGVVVVATSNRPPGDLYEGGINRGYFLPFIDLLRRHCIVHEVKSGTDYRRLLAEGVDEFFFVSGQKSSDGTVDAGKKCDDVFERLLNGSDASHLELDIAFNRTLIVKRAHPDGIVGRFDFSELCSTELGSSDYRAIAEEFQVVMIERIPILTLKEHDQARRFITLLDELYEAGCALVCSAVAPPEELFRGRDIAATTSKPEADSIDTKVGEMFGIDVAQSSGRTIGELASVRELSFAFRRASSRLTEMCSRKWWEKINV